MPVEWVNYRTRIISFRGARGGGARPISGAEERGHADETDRTPRCARAADLAGELSEWRGIMRKSVRSWVVYGGLGEVGEVGK